MKPAALAKAESLARYVTHSGAPHSEFTLAITLGEAYELLDHLVAAHPGNAMLESDVLRAKAESDPWRVLANFTLRGFELVRADLLN